jgi:hypothetical protein
VRQDDPAAGRKPVRDASLLGQQVEAKLTDLPAEVASVRFAEILSTLGKQPDMEVHPAEVTIAQPGQPGPDFGLDLNRI